MSGGFTTRTDLRELRPLVGELGSMTPRMRLSLRSGFRDAGESARRRAQARASWSSRIPGATVVRPLTGATTAGVFLRVNAARAPHARPYEGMTGRNPFRHPVFGDRSVWVAERTRPFLVPAVQETRPKVMGAAVDAIRDAARAGGFR